MARRRSPGGAVRTNESGGGRARPVAELDAELEGALARREELALGDPEQPLNAVNDGIVASPTPSDADLHGFDQA